MRLADKIIKWMETQKRIEQLNWDIAANVAGLVFWGLVLAAAIHQIIRG
jgi:hypothetical protein